ncbi:MAG: ABC transporter ATP-binding protein [Chloroflexia bacterium]
MHPRQCVASGLPAATEAGADPRRRDGGTHSRPEPGRSLSARARDRSLHTRGDLPGLARIVGLMVVVYALVSLLTWLQIYVMAGAAQRTVRDIRKDLFDKMQSLPLRYFDTRSHGDLMSRLSNDVETINQVLAESVAQIVAGLLTTVGIVVIMLLLNPTLAVISLVSVTTMTLLVTRWSASRTRDGFRIQQSSLGELNGLIEETIGGQKVVKAYGRERAVIERFSRTNDDYRRSATRAQIYAGFMGPLMNLVSNIGLAVVAGVGGWMALQGAASVGTIASFINYTRQFGRPLNEIAVLYNQIQAAVAGAERVFEVIDEAPEADAPDAAALPQIRGDVVFDDVGFSYVEGIPVLKRMSLHAERGSTVALVGPTGVGKTTVVNLPTRFYEVDSGSILIDGGNATDKEGGPAPTVGDAGTPTCFGLGDGQHPVR